MKKIIILSSLFCFLPFALFAECPDCCNNPTVEKCDCACPQAKGDGMHKGLAEGVGATAAAGMLSAPAGLNAALGSMAIVGGFSILTGSITNSDQKMFYLLQNRAAKIIRKNKSGIPFKKFNSGKYELAYGDCQSSPKEVDILKADDVYAKLKESNPELISSWEKVHSGDTAFFVSSDKGFQPALLFYDRTILIFDQAGKKPACTGNVKAGSFNKTVVLYCTDSEPRFCNRVYTLAE